MRIRLESVQLASGVPFGGAHTSTLMDSSAAQLEYDSDDELVFARAKRAGSKTLLIPETNILFMVAYVEPIAKPEPPKASPEQKPAPKDDTIRAIAPGKTERAK